MSETVEGQVLLVKIADIHCDDEFNSRGHIIATDVVELARDIEANGLIQPITVMEYSEEERSHCGKKYKLIAGFRRTQAHIVIRKDSILAIIKPHMNDAQATLMNLSENLNRKDLTILQEAKAIQRLRVYDMTEEEISNRIGKSRGWVQVRTMLLSLPTEIQQEVEAGFVTHTQIRELYSVYRAAGKEAVFSAAKRIKDAKASGQRTPVCVNPNKMNKDAKRLRSRPEVVEMTEHVFDCIGPGLATRCLAWVAGEISDNELDKSLKEACDQVGKTFIEKKI